MNDISLLTLAKKDIISASMELNYEGDFLLSKCAYNISQACEKMLKFCIHLSGRDFPKTHRICRLIEMAIDIECYIPHSVREKCSIIESWTVETRYNNYMIFSRSELNLLLSDVVDWVNYISQELGVDTL